MLAEREAAGLGQPFTQHGDMLCTQIDSAPNGFDQGVLVSQMDTPDQQSTPLAARPAAGAMPSPIRSPADGNPDGSGPAETLSLTPNADCAPDAQLNGAVSRNEAPQNDTHSGRKQKQSDSVPALEEDIPLWQRILNPLALWTGSGSKRPVQQSPAPQTSMPDPPSIFVPEHADQSAATPPKGSRVGQVGPETLQQPVLQGSSPALAQPAVCLSGPYPAMATASTEAPVYACGQSRLPHEAHATWPHGWTPPLNAPARNSSMEAHGNTALQGASPAWDPQQPFSASWQNLPALAPGYPTLRQAPAVGTGQVPSLPQPRSPAAIGRLPQQPSMVGQQLRASLPGQSFHAGGFQLGSGFAFSDLRGPPPDRQHSIDRRSIGMNANADPQGGSQTFLQELQRRSQSLPPVLFPHQRFVPSWNTPFMPDRPLPGHTYAPQAVAPIPSALPVATMPPDMRPPIMAPPGSLPQKRSPGGHSRPEVYPQQQPALPENGPQLPNNCQQRRPPSFAFRPAVGQVLQGDAFGTEPRWPVNANGLPALGVGQGGRRIGSIEPEVGAAFRHIQSPILAQPTNLVGHFVPDTGSLAGNPAAVRRLVTQRSEEVTSMPGMHPSMVSAPQQASLMPAGPLQGPLLSAGYAQTSTQDALSAAQRIDARLIAQSNAPLLAQGPQDHAQVLDARLTASPSLAEGIGRGQVHTTAHQLITPGQGILTTASLAPDGLGQGQTRARDHIPPSADAPGNQGHTGATSHAQRPTPTPTPTTALACIAKMRTRQHAASSSGPAAAVAASAAASGRSRELQEQAGQVAGGAPGGVVPIAAGESVGAGASEPRLQDAVRVPAAGPQPNSGSQREDATGGPTEGRQLHAASQPKPAGGPEPVGFTQEDDAAAAAWGAAQPSLAVRSPPMHTPHPPHGRTPAVGPHQSGPSPADEPPMPGVRHSPARDLHAAARPATGFGVAEPGPSSLRESEREPCLPDQQTSHSHGDLGSVQPHASVQGLAAEHWADGDSSEDCDIVADGPQGGPAVKASSPWCEPAGASIRDGHSLPNGAQPSLTEDTPRAHGNPHAAANLNPTSPHVLPARTPLNNPQRLSVADAESRSQQRHPISPSSLRPPTEVVSLLSPTSPAQPGGHNAVTEGLKAREQPLPEQSDAPEPAGQTLQSAAAAAARPRPRKLPMSMLRSSLNAPHNVGRPEAQPKETGQAAQPDVASCGQVDDLIYIFGF